MPVERVAVGEAVVVRPGEMVSVDGVVSFGRTAVDQAPITGESLPVEKAPGDEVFAGTLNGDGAIEVCSTKPASDTTLARILEAVQEAQATRAPSQAFVERFARVYTPLVVGGAALMVVLPPLLGFGGWAEWFARALVLLVVACPCALVISTPVTVVSALAGAARQGVLIKGGLHLEAAGRARVIALDKTGTLTEGRPAVADVIALDGATPREVLALAAAAEARSAHPLARAILERAATEGIEPAAGADAAAIPGRGVWARVGEEIAVLGSGRLFAEMGAGGAELVPVLERIEAAGQTVVLVGSAPGGGADAPPRLRGAIAIADRIRAGAGNALGALRGAGIDRIVMLTGDNEGAARAVADALAAQGAPLDEVRSGLLPEDKLRAVQEVRRRYGPVLFVGDGINDAPALAAADVGVAMGAAGSDVALETADIALMADDLSRLPVAVRLARKAEGIIRANIALSLLTKAVFVALALSGAATLWMAVVADMGTSLVVVGNGMRALRE